MTHLDIDQISAHADGEQSAEVDAHLNDCAECREWVAALRALKHAIGQLDGRDDVPGAVRARVEQLALHHRGARRRLRRAAWVGVACAAVGALAAGALWVARPAPLSEELVADHLRSVPDRLPGEVVSEEPETVRAFFRDRVDFDPVVPSLPESRLLGGRSCTIRGQRVQLLFYERRRQTLSLFVFGDRIQTDGCERHQGHEVCCHHAGDRTLMLVGPLPRGDLDRLVHEAVL